MHLYIHEFKDIKDNRIKEVRDVLFKNSLGDYQSRTGLKQRSLKVETMKHGKPFFPKAQDLHFSISHSGRYWVCLFDKDIVGVDIEDYSSRNMPMKRFVDISGRYFKADEGRYVLGDFEPDSSETEASEDDMESGIKNRFFKIWTAKEAYMKYTGNGFSEGFKNFSVLDDSMALCYREVPVDPKAVLTFCSKRDTNLDEMITI